jgi:hypothetical protein
MTPLTNQQIIDRVRHYFSQTGAVLGYDVYADTCVYKGENGEKCAVGCLIPPSHYRSDFEGLSVESVFPYIFDLFADDGACVILRELQTAHDDACVELDGGGVPRFLKKLAVIEAKLRADGYLPYSQ